MNNHEDAIERIHASNMRKRESEMNAGPSKSHPAWTKMAIAASVAALVALSIFTITSNQPQSLEVAKANEPTHYPDTDHLAAEPSEPQSATSVTAVPHNDDLTVVCQNDCAAEEVLQRFEQTLLSLN